ncbi:MAG: MarC family protein [Bosea sp. (in: a-proteobacteria)]|uniref:MarC family protein n=1 Tax=unclassified Bosea (in: a-proteobacteria) TaxID=2653178 RepID=UPI00095AD448|nr:MULTISPECIES: MarC family protein [unclassified Bosea (in: a-proteobacteria)]MBN9441483.1 MarC family protein [Bosea sp. (in: a-proteobacteria)]MBN9455984.1 MarC family protein [Bosea sp. (in: a-proteobacteria)]OJV05862.1 MAG: MarC family transcriptional regulator [Bosea sp. 67-29]
MERWLTEFVKLWVVIDPIGTLPVFLAVTAGMAAGSARRVAIQGTLVAFAVLVFFVVLGQILLNAMEIELSSFQIAGNIVLFLFALTMIFGESKLEEDQKLLRSSDLEKAVYPLAIPSIASPGAMLTVMTVTDNSKFSIPEQMETLVQIGLILALLLLLLFGASRIIAVIGNAGASVISRVMGLILASVAVDGIIKALRVVLTG